MTKATREAKRKNKGKEEAIPLPSKSKAKLRQNFARSTEQGQC